MSSTSAEVRQAVEVILSDKKAYATSLNYAVLRCQQLLTAPDSELKERILYIIGNITHWRHPKAKEVRATLRAYKGD